MIDDYYQDIDLYRYTEGEFSTPDDYSKIQTFKGLVQTPSSRNSFVNAKDTMNVDGILFCDISLNSIIQENDLIEYEGIKYIVSGKQSQPLGVSGIEPDEGQHCEFKLQFYNKNV
ncbi:MAG: hypothetical protein BV457_00240 [Thermoplasmata archaeon M9B1D]|nr:MAG: hypothetical protein BV457_00240 [Thermoplasmata archaeon M9B1D]PNX52206.1 MAG: hypothetical protein BV456_00055 [Thermoplasmata archaeon M8B2D]